MNSLKQLQQLLHHFILIILYFNGFFIAKMHIVFKGTVSFKLYNNKYMVVLMKKKNLEYTR